MRGKFLALFHHCKNMGVRQLAPCIFAVSGSVNLQAVRKELEKTGVFVRITWRSLLASEDTLLTPYFLPTAGINQLNSLFACIQSSERDHLLKDGMAQQATPQ